MPKKFAWSWSRLKNYRACPKRHYEIDLAKNIKEPQSEAVLWGNRFHDAMAKRIKGVPLTPEFSHYEKWPALIASYKADVECDMAVNESFQPTGWFADDTWLRVKIDARLVNGSFAMAFDWKTGKIEPEFEQLAITAQVIFSTYPEVEQVATAYIWAKYNDDTTKVYTRADMPELWARLLPEVKAMERASIEMNYPPKPSGLCKHYCPVTHCPYHGKGSR